MRKLTWKSHCRHLTKLIKLGNAASCVFGVLCVCVCINILLLLQQGGETDKCSNYAFMSVFFQACVALWRRLCCVGSKRLCNCSENSWDFWDMCVFLPEVRQNLSASFCNNNKNAAAFESSVWPWALVFSSLRWELACLHYRDYMRRWMWWSLWTIQNRSQFTDRSY